LYFLMTKKVFYTVIGFLIPIGVLAYFPLIGYFLYKLNANKTWFDIVLFIALIGLPPLVGLIFKKLKKNVGNYELIIKGTGYFFWILVMLGVFSVLFVLGKIIFVLLYSR